MCKQAMAAPAPSPGSADSDPLAALLAADPALAAQLAQLSPGEAPSGGPSRLAALLAANPSLRAMLPPAPGEGPADAGTNPDNAKVCACSLSLSLHPICALKSLNIP